MKNRLSLLMLLSLFVGVAPVAIQAFHKAGPITMMGMGSPSPQGNFWLLPGFIEVNGKKIAAVAKATDISNPDNIDRSFGANGVATVPVGYESMFDMVQNDVTNDGNIIINGIAKSSDQADYDIRFNARLNTDGTLDESFGQNGIEITGGKLEQKQKL